MKKQEQQKNGLKIMMASYLSTKFGVNSLDNVGMTAVTEAVAAKNNCWYSRPELNTPDITIIH